jgi:hypothetical protein
MSFLENVVVWYFFGSYAVMAVILFTTRSTTKELFDSAVPHGTPAAYGFTIAALWAGSPITLIAATRVKVKFK